MIYLVVANGRIVGVADNVTMARLTADHVVRSGHAEEADVFTFRDAHHDYTVTENTLPPEPTEENS